VYDPFSSIVKNSGRQVVTNQLLCTEGRYEMNLAELEMLAQKPENKVMILCSPHNPVGRVWTKEELIAVADICGKNGVMLVSDEIHSDIVFNNATHYPLLGLKKEYSKFVIQLGAPGKTFNIAGLKCSMAYIKDEEVRKKFANTQIAMSLDVKNTFGIEGVIAAYTLEGEEWMSQELEYMQGNVEYVMDFVKTQMPDVSMAPPQGTFLCWLDLSRLGLSDEEIMKKVVLEAGVICVPGPWFGKGGEQHLRLNIGCTRKNLTAAMERIRDSLYAK
ncbi:MAG: aminotransferase class I/II-fold pyridoxal phosphate-dependent enzyme, partial [Oscillospiraceae bacterium]